MLIPTLEVAREGYDLNTCEDIQKNIDSTKNTIKEYITFTGTLSAGVSNYNPYVDLNHNLGWYPLVEGYFKLSTESFYRTIPYMYRWEVTGVYHKIEVGRKHLDTNNIRIQLRTDDWRAVGETISIDYIVVVNLISDTDAWY